MLRKQYGAMNSILREPGNQLHASIHIDKFVYNNKNHITKYEQQIVGTDNFEENLILTRNHVGTVGANKTS